ncbi:MbtH family NRPS accessory protein [Micromonospora sp. Llam7]|uniref:MbtH family protein n=1 Tax=Micromonospora tarapacensis TaxID=2835305 RepID=UPI001C83CB44|nr:MbtH family NRPS accessory protein [Micromonospora tarapacensis]
MSIDEPYYRVVVNDEEQYSLWPLHKEPAVGWRDVGTSGSRSECLAEIKRIWTDLRPKSLRV